MSVLQHLVDTHIAVWWLQDDEKLSRQQRRVLARAQSSGGSVGLSTMTLWEIAKLVERRRLRMDRAVDECLADLEQSDFFTVLPITARIAAESTRLGAAFPSDPADQIIAATARCHGLTLLTVDTRIRAAAVVAVI